MSYDLKELIASLTDADLELENVSIDAEELIFEVKKQILAQRPPSAKADVKPKRLEFFIPKEEYTGEIAEVQLGATKGDGGTRGKVVKMGGQISLYSFEGGAKNRPVISYDVFDIPMPSFAKSLREEWQDVWESPADWAKKAVDLGADMITLHLISTDPGIKDTPPKVAAKTVEDVLQAVDVPLVIGGSGNPEKDPVLFEVVGAAAEGELCLLASANLDLDHKRIVDAANKYRHNVLSWTSMNITDQQMLNKLLLGEGLPKERMVQDPTTGALGYGLEYTYSIIERLKLNALRGEAVLQNPISCGVTNAWAAREAWMNEPSWGPREYRGPLWEIVTATTVLRAGADLMMMLHPQAVKAIKEIIDAMVGGGKSEPLAYEDWVSA
ncbi:MAG: CO dehydrogenase/acetyl-CoA synthase subunit delta [Candidatus Hydrothermarchaeaceae archaeon]